MRKSKKNRKAEFPPKGGFSMKVVKVMILSLLGFNVSEIVASDLNPGWKPKYVGEWHVGYSTSSKIQGIKTYSARAMLGTLQGVSLNKYAQVALGVDAHMLTHYYKGQGLRFALATYVDLRGFYPVTSEFSPFINLALGAGFNLKPSGGDPGFYCEFGPGIKYHKFNLSCGLLKLGSGKGSSHFFVKTGFYF